MKLKLKKIRVDMGMTQMEIAKAVGVSQPNYQRWEAGAASIPEDKLQKLAKVLKVDARTIFGRHPPIEAHVYNNTVGDDLNHYGEVAIHFRGGGAPLLLSISEEAFKRLHRDLQGQLPFVTVESLANQTVAVRTSAIGDLYFSSEAYDDYGPEHGHYPNHISIQMPDPRDWEIVEAFALDGDLEDFDPSDVQRVKESIMITDEQYEKLVADGAIKIEDLANERAKNQAKTDAILDTAYKTVYQLSTGLRRSVWVDEPEALFEAFYELTDFDGGQQGDDLILLAAEGYHRTIFINKEALDYVAIPTHKYREGRTEFDAEGLDAP